MSGGGLTSSLSIRRSSNWLPGPHSLVRVLGEAHGGGHARLPVPVAVPPAIAAAQPGAQVAARAVAPAGTRPGVTAAAGQTGAAGASLSTRSRRSRSACGVTASRWVGKRSPPAPS